MSKVHSKIFFLIILGFFIPLSAFDIVGVGASVVDILAKTEEEAIQQFQGVKGDSTLVSWEQYQRILNEIPEKNRHIKTGGSCSNTIIGLANLGQKTAYCTHMGNDQLSQYYLDTIGALHIEPYYKKSQKPMQQVISLITPDSQRSMFCYLGATEDFSCDDLNLDFFKKCRLVYTEGYILYNKNLVESAIAIAKANGALVAFDLSSPRVVNTFKKEIFHLLSHGIDILFANEEESQLLTGLEPKESAEQLAKLCSVAVVKIGKEGCWVSSKGSTFHCPGYAVHAVDTTGAGDPFAAGFLHAYLQGYPLSFCGDCGNRVGSQVVQVIGCELSEKAWGALRCEKYSQLK